jgi:hypothetical protein
MCERAKALEEKAASVIREIERRDACFSRITLLSGEDDGRNKTYSVLEVFGLLLPRTSECAKRYMRERHIQPYGGGSVITVTGVYATTEGIVIQFHKAIVNSYGTVKDYTWFTHLSFEIETRLREGKLTPEQLEEILEAAEKDIKEIEEMAAEMMSYKVEEPYRGLGEIPFEIIRELEYEEAKQLFEIIRELECEEAMKAFFLSLA